MKVGKPNVSLSVKGGGCSGFQYEWGTTDKEPLGRPIENPTNRDKQEGNFGKDRLGRKGMKKDYNDTSKSLSELDSNIVIYSSASVFGI